MAEVESPVGRIVWGNPLKAQQKKDNNKPPQPIFKDGVPVMQWSFGVAFDKNQFAATIWPVMAAAAQKDFPQGQPSGYAWKYVDGDGVDSEGKPFRDREGYAGCYVLAINTQSHCPPVYKFNTQTGKYDQVPEDGIKTGDYVVVNLNIVGHVAKERTHNSGLYINPVAIELVGYGQPIINGPDPMTLFGGRQRQLPPGASTTPLSAAPAGVGMPGTGQQPMQQGGMMTQQPMGGGQQMMPMTQQQPVQQQMPGQMPMQMQGQQPVQQQQQPMGGGQQMMPMTQQGGYAPATDYVQQTTGQPMQMQGGMMPMQQQPIQQQMQPMGGGQQPMPGQMPGMMPGR